MRYYGWVRLRKPLDAAARKRFAEDLRARVLEWVGSDASRRALLAHTLKKRGTVRLDQYASGVHYPTPAVLRRIADAIGESWLTLYANAGYQRELLLPLYRLAQRQQTKDGSRRRKDDEALFRAHGSMLADEKPWSDVAARFSVRSFPRRNESLAVENSYGIALDQILVDHPLRDEAEKKLLRGESVRDALPPLLKRAYDILVDDEYPANLRTEHAGDFVRTWARGLSSSEVDRAESLFYNSGPLAVHPIGSLAQALAPIISARESLSDKPQDMSRDSRSLVDSIGKPPNVTLQINAAELEHETKADPSR